MIKLKWNLYYAVKINESGGVSVCKKCRGHFSDR